MAHIRESLAKLLPQPQATFSDQKYLLGLRGLLVIESFLWVFLQTFVPVTVKGSGNVHGHLYQEILRKTFSVLFWNESLIYSFFIILSARTICLPFLKNPQTSQVASPAFRRGLRLFFPLAVALAIVKLTFSLTGTNYIVHFKTQTKNVSFNSPYIIPNALAYFNSVGNLFWVTRQFSQQAGSTAFPTQTLWVINAIYTQSFTVYMTMVIIPFTRATWRVKAYIVFIACAWWVQSWAWYTISGLLLADAVMNMDFKAASKRGIHVWRGIRCPSWIPYLLVLAAGLVLQYLWTAWREQYQNSELKYHTGLYYTGGLNAEYDPNGGQARDDNYLVVMGVFLFLESYDFLQVIFSNPLFLFLGTRSLSYFLVQSTIVYTAGIKLYLHLIETSHLAGAAATTVTLIVCLLSTIGGAEVFYRLVDYPSQVFARFVFEWIRK